MNRARLMVSVRARAAVGWARNGRHSVVRHPRHLVLAALLAGLILGPIWPSGVLLAALAALSLAGRAGVALAAAAAVMGGAALAQARSATLDAHAVQGAVGEHVVADGVLLEPVRHRLSGMRAARLRLVGGRADGAIATARVSPGARWPAHVEVGDTLVLAGRLAGLADHESHQRRRGAHVALEVRSARATGERRGGLPGALDGIRRRAEAALAAGGPRAQAQLLRGMVLGQDEGIEEPVREEFRRTGLAHLLAASGQNVMLLVILAIAAATALGAGLRGRLMTAMVLVAVYVPLAGAGPSIQRAGIMGAAGLVAALAGRPASRWYAVCLAAALTLVVNPRAAGEPGWQLSFAAVVALLLLASPLTGWLTRRGAPRPLAAVAAITVAATVGTAPLMALHFGTVSPASLPANLLVAPAVAPIMWLGMLAATVGQVSVAAAAPLSGMAAYLAAYVEWVAHTAAGHSFASVDVRVERASVAALAYVGLGLAVLAGRSAARWSPRWRVGLPRGARLSAALATATFLTVVALTRGGLPPRAPGELVVSFLAVGQGDATLLQHDETTVLIDTGPPGGPILQRLREAGVRNLDALIITHAQADHEGMAVAVMRAHRTEFVINGGAGRNTPVQRLLPQLIGRARAQALVPAAGQVVSFGSLRMRVLWPPAVAVGAPGPKGDPNLHAMVSHVSLGDFDLLLPADAESVVTGQLELGDVEALKVAHHGSADEGLAAELDRLRPEVAAIEVGERNTHGHPTASTLAALRAVPHVVRTDRDGTVRLRVDGGRMRLERSGAGVGQQ
jgi:competence protein ComEC